MPTAQFQFQPDLNNFLSPDRRGGAFTDSFNNGQTVKHLIESAGVPHTEVGQVLVNQQPAGLEYQVREGDHVNVFPAAFENAPLLIAPRFVLDNHLGRLAAYLRMLGFDVIYRNHFDDEELAQISAAEDRILLTRDRRLLMRKSIRYGYCLRSLDSHQQILEILRRYNLFNQFSPFQRCLHCNTPLQTIRKEEISDQLLPLTRKYYEEFRMCPACGHIYWKGSHYERMQEMIEALRKQQHQAGYGGDQ